MSKFIDLTGQKFNKLTVIERMPSRKGKTVWKCQCDCGKYTTVEASNLKTGQVKSCGCLSNGHPTHNESKTTLYRDWASMLSRCYNPKEKAYKNYGGKGIKVCDEWHDFLAFKKWVSDTKPKCKEALSIDRINPNGDYCPDNCRWATRKIQQRNRTTNLIYEHNGKSQTLIEWCEELGLDYKRMHNRVYKLHWTFEKAISTPVNESKRNKETREKWQNTLKSKLNQ